MSLTMNSKGVECQKEGCRSLTWVPIITPCAHLLCTACTAKNKYAAFHHLPHESPFIATLKLCPAVGDHAQKRAAPESLTEKNTRYERPFIAAAYGRYIHLLKRKQHISIGDAGVNVRCAARPTSCRVWRTRPGGR